MPEAKKTEYLSVRIDDEERAHIEGIREELHERNGILPPRSEVVRKCLGLGMTAFCEEHDIELPAYEKPEEKKSTRTKKSSRKGAK